MKDLIDRQAALDTFGPWLNVEGYSEGELNMLRAVLYELKTLPTAQPEQKKGHWIEIQAPDSDGNGLYECSICHRGEVHVPIVEVPFCWHCGADMTEGEG